MGNQPSAPHEPLDRANVRNVGDVNVNTSTKASLRASFSRRTRAGGGAGMDRLRRSFRESFRRRKGGDGGGGGGDFPESARPHQWHADEASVRAAACAFPVKYLGCVEVFESRGMNVCEEALKVLRSSRRRPVRSILHVSGDGLRVVEEETKGLIVDQTIEKVSFCAPDRNHERGFSYICRDGTTRRWMCHGFLASRDSGERLSHAVGCAFASCLERKQRRDKECAVSMSIDAASGAFTRQGSFRPSGITDRKAAESTTHTNTTVAIPTPPPAPPRPAHNPFAIERPHAAPHMLERQGSFRGFAHLNNNSPFKRQMSLRLNELPSNLERQRLSFIAASAAATSIPEAPAAPETLPQMEADPVAAMCRQLARGLQALAAQGNEEVPPVEPPTLAPLPLLHSLPDPDQWLGRISRPSPAPSVSPKAPPFSAQSRAKSFAGTDSFRDPFNSDWQPTKNVTTNPFLQQTPFPIN